jgi:hypothetical protein
MTVSTCRDMPACNAVICASCAKVGATFVLAYSAFGVPFQPFSRNFPASQALPVAAVVAIC